MSALDLGKRLLSEVEEVGLDEILSTLRLQNRPIIEHFGLPPLDSLLTSLSQHRSYLSQQHPPVIELTSLNPAGGKTHLLYHLTALAVLPTHLGGKQSCVTILDTDGRFSVPRLAQQLKLIASEHINHEDPTVSTDAFDHAILEALTHVHLFHPQTLPSTLATLQSLGPYLFNPSRHHSSQRALNFIAVDSVSAFHWQIRAETEDLLVPSSDGPTNPGYASLATALRSAAKTFECAIVLTSWHLAPSRTPHYPESDARGFKPPLPLPMQALVDLRLVVRRAAVRKFPAEITLEEARRDAESRQKVVEEGRFECFVNGWEVDERLWQALGRGVNGFRFWITDCGLRLKVEDHEERGE